MRPSSAHALVSLALSRGELIRQPCETCGEQKAVAHHDDYERPLDVRWLCASCHMKHHHRNGRGLNADPETFLVRAALTQDEWARIRHMALDKAMPVSRLVADTLRANLLNGKAPA